MASTTSTTSTNFTASSAFPLTEFNFASNLPIKLCATNYPTWHKQIMHLLKANNLEGYVTGSVSCPSPTIGIGESAQSNPAHLHWCRQDNHVSLALLGSCSPEAQVVMSSATSSADAWNKLQKAFSNRSRARIMSLKERLASITKGTSSVHDYLRSIRSIGDELALIGHSIDDIDLVIAALNGLGPSFREFSAAIRTRDSPLQFDELFDKLVDFEIFLQRDEQQVKSVPITANYTNRNFSKGNQGNRGKFYNNRRPSSSQSSDDGPVCQFCDKSGHTARTCYKINGYPPRSSKRPQAHIVQKSTTDSSEWLLDFGASHHITHDFGALNLSQDAPSSDHIIVADGKGFDNEEDTAAWKK